MSYNDVGDVFQWAHGVLDKTESRILGTRLSRAYGVKIRVKLWSPPVFLSTTHETEEPFRVSRTLMIHVTPHTAVGIGFWSLKGLPEHEALLNAVRDGLEVTYSDLEHFDDEVVAERSGFGWAGGKNATRLQHAALDAGD